MRSFGLIEFHDWEDPNPAELRIRYDREHCLLFEIKVLDEPVPRRGVLRRNWFSGGIAGLRGSNVVDHPPAAVHHHR